MQLLNPRPLVSLPHLLSSPDEPFNQHCSGVCLHQLSSAAFATTIPCQAPIQASSTCIRQSSKSNIPIHISMSACHSAFAMPFADELAAEAAAKLKQLNKSGGKAANAGGLGPWSDAPALEPPPAEPVAYTLATVEMERNRCASVASAS